jgi:hypothetical protein
MRGRLFGYLTVFFLLGLGGAISTIPGPTPCWGSESGEDPLVFSLAVRDKSLREVLEEISRTTGYKILVDEKWEKFPITVKLRDMGIHEGLQKVLKEFNHALVIVDEEKKISIEIYDVSPDSRYFVTLPVGGKSNPPLQQQKINPHSPEMLPPDISGVEKTTQQRQKIDPSNLEVIPPDISGGRGITHGEIEAANRRRKKIDPLDLEIIPPEVPGEAGLTLREVEAMKAHQKKVDPKDFILPPD